MFAWQGQVTLCELTYKQHGVTIFGCVGFEMLDYTSGIHGVVSSDSDKAEQMDRL